VEIDDLETVVLNDPTPQALHRALSLKRSLIEFRRNAAAMREVVNHLLRDAPREQVAYLRDVYDHLVRTIDLIETDRDLVSGALDIYLSSIANRTNEIVKVLTIYGTIALPWIVITGFYGMNLRLPFQESGHGLAIAVGLMITSAVGVVVYFWRRKWL
jgi:magnesium transporter